MHWTHTVPARSGVGICSQKPADLGLQHFAIDTFTLDKIFIQRLSWRVLALLAPLAIALTFAFAFAFTFPFASTPGTRCSPGSHGLRW
jgi:hypothetical protein